MSAKAFVKWFPSDYLNGIADLDYKLIAVYSVVLNLIYDNDGPIANDPERLGRRIGMRPSSCGASISELLRMKKLILVDGMLSNKRSEKVIETRQKVSEKSKEAAAARWNKDREKYNDFSAEEMPPHIDRISTTNAYQKPEARSQKPEKKDGAGAPSDLFGSEPVIPDDPKKRLFALGKKIFGGAGVKDPGACTAKLLKAREGNVRLALKAMEDIAGCGGDPMEYFGRIIAKSNATITGIPGADQYNRAI